MTFDYSSIGFYTFDCLARPIAGIPEGGGVAFVPEVTLAVSGTAGSCAIAGAELGLKTLAVGALGNDQMADWVLGRIVASGCDVSGMQRIAGLGTSTSIVLTRADGTRPYLHMKGASGELWLDDSQLDRATDARIVHLGGTGLLDRLDGAPSALLLKRAQDRGAITTLDLISGSPDCLKLVTPLLPHTSYFIPSIEEAAALAGRFDREDVAHYFLDCGAGCVILTLGEHGVYYCHSDGTSFTIPAFEIDVVDTCGCGDAFDAGFAAALCHELDAETAVRFAQATAALVATRLGSNAGLRSFDATWDFMNTTRTRSNHAATMQTDLVAV